METRRAVSSKHVQKRDFAFFVAVRSFTADSGLLHLAGECEQHTSHVTFSHFFTLIYTHMRGSSRKFGVRTSHSMRHLRALMLCVLSLFDFSTFLSLLSIFSLIILSSFLAINFIFHDVVDKFPVHSS